MVVDDADPDCRAALTGCDLALSSRRLPGSCMPLPTGERVSE